jgi:hypothetical protein
MSDYVTSLQRSAEILGAESLVGVSPRPLDLLPVHRVSPFTGFVSCEGGSDAVVLNPCRVRSLEDRIGRRDRWTSADLDSLLGSSTGLESDRARPFRLLPYTTSAAWQAVAEECGASWLVPKVSDNRQLHDKILMRDNLRRLGIPVPASAVVASQQLCFRTLANQFGEPLVLQKRFGSAGNGTYLVRDAGELDRTLAKNSRTPQWLVSEYSGRCGLNFHALVTGRGVVVVADPSIQISGIKGLGSSFGGYCGSWLGVKPVVPEPALLAARGHIARIGRWLAAAGYVGIYGVDCVRQGDRLTVVEINARVQASTWLLGECELAVGRIPLLVRHFVELLGHPTEDPAPTLTLPAATQLVVRWTGSPFVLRDKPQPGRYQLEGEGALPCGPLTELWDCEDDEIGILSVPRRGVRVSTGAVIARVVSRAPLVSPDGLKLNTLGQLAVRAVRALISS